MEPYSAALMLNLLSTTPKKGVPVLFLIGPWLLDSLASIGTRFCDQDSSITALGDNGRIDHDPIEAYRQWCSQNAHAGHPSSQWSSCFARDLLGLVRPVQTRWYPSLGNQSHTRFDPVGYGQIRSRSSLGSYPDYGKSLSWQSSGYHSRPRGSCNPHAQRQQPSWLKWLISLHFLEQMR